MRCIRSVKKKLVSKYKLGLMTFKHPSITNRINDPSLTYNWGLWFNGTLDSTSRTWLITPLFDILIHTYRREVVIHLQHIHSDLTSFGTPCSFNVLLRRVYGYQGWGWYKRRERSGVNDGVISQEILVNWLLFPGSNVSQDTSYIHTGFSFI